MSRRFVAGFVVRRLAVMVVLLVVVSFCVFSLLYLAPGNPVEVLLGTRPNSPQLVASLRAEYHLNDSFLDQYWLWLRGAAHLNFGNSIITSEPVLSEIGPAANVSIFLTVYAFVLTLLVGVPLGVWAAVRKRTLVDRGVVGISVIGVCAPPFVSGALLLYVFAIALGWFPVYGVGGGFWDRLWHLSLPAVTLGLSVAALVVKLTRAAMITALEQDHVIFARARGVPAWRVVLLHAMRNALIPIVTALGLVFTALLTGVVLVEVTFAVPGMGALLISAIQNKDMPVVQGVTMIFAVIIIVANIGVDMLYALVDPRIRYGTASS